MRQRELTRSVSVEALWLRALELVFLANTEIVLNDSGEHLFEVGRSMLADLQNDFVLGAKKGICRNKKSPTAASDFCRQISKFHGRAVTFGMENQIYRLANFWAFYLPISEFSP